METSANNLNFFCVCFTRIRGLYKKNLKAASGLKMENEAPDLTAHTIKRYAKLTTPTRLEKKYKRHVSHYVSKIVRPPNVY